MLCKRPERAQPPIVDGRKWTFAAARISAASARVIQSVGAAIGQSGVFDAPDVVGFSVFFDVPERDEPPDSDDTESAFLDADPDPSASDDAAASLFEPSSDPELSPLLFDAPDAAEVRRSFLAQPEPL